MRRIWWGGCVRDSILGREPGDWDICTNALPEEMIAAFADYRLVLNGLKHGTVTVIIMHTAIEITTYRIDGEYEDNRHPQGSHLYFRLSIRFKPPRFHDQCFGV